MTLTARLLIGAGAAAMLASAAPMHAYAEDATAAILQRLEALERENQKLRSEIKRVEGKVAAKPATKAAPTATAQAPAVDANGAPIVTASMIPTADKGIISTSGAGYNQAPKVNSDWYFEKLPGSGLNFKTPGGQIALYGQFDISVDSTTKGISNKIDSSGGRPLGSVSWQPALSSNLLQKLVSAAIGKSTIG